jgi:soluble lytic murein transglycosylase-like protein
MKNKKLIIFAILALLLVILSSNIIISSISKPRPPTPAERLCAAIYKFAPIYDVPLNVAFNVARLETGYRGPFHENYNHKQTSRCGALGPMQIMPQYASHHAGFKVTKQQLKDSIELNVEISMKMLQYWYDRYDNWIKATGAYNTGRPIPNKYAKAAVNTKYTDFWVIPDSTQTNFTGIISQ